MGLTIEQAIKSLTPLLEKEKLSIFVGSGASVDSGLPTWDGLIDLYIDICEQCNNDLPKDVQFTEIINDARMHKNRDLIRTVSVLKHELKELKSKNYNFDRYWKSELELKFGGAEPNDFHKMIVGTDYKYILTTNYDNLLEKTAKELKFSYLNFRSYSFKESDRIAQSLYENTPGIIHVHGTTSDISIDEFVLTSRDYYEIKKNNPGFRLVLQNIFLTYSILFYGYGGSDPHLEELLEELNYFFNSSPRLPQYFIVLQKSKVDQILKRYKNINRTQIIEIEDFKEGLELLSRLREIAPRK